MKKLITLFMVMLLTGCAYDQGIHVRNQIVNFGIELDKEMVGVNYMGAVLENEEYLTSYSRANKMIAHGQDATPGSDIEPYRFVIIRTIRYGTNITARLGHAYWTTVAIVPDHIPKLHRFDIVEYRNIGTWRTMKDFLTTGEGNAVLRVVCKYGEPDYDACVNAQPKIANFLGVGPTGTEYKPSLKDYGFTFSKQPKPEETFKLFNF